MIAWSPPPPDSTIWIGFDSQQVVVGVVQRVSSGAYYWHCNWQDPAAGYAETLDAAMDNVSRVVSGRECVR